MTNINSEVFNRHFSRAPVQRLREKDKKPLQAVLQYEDHLLREQVHVVFFGVFKAGKSTLLNAILGTNLLPTANNRVTGAVTRIRKANSESATIVFYDGRPPQQVSVDQAGEYIRLDTSRGKSTARNDINYVELCIRNPRLANNAVYIDTPGLRDTPQLTERVRKELDQADLAVMLVDATQPLGDEEREEARRVNKSLNGNLIFAISYLERVEKDTGEVIEWVNGSLADDDFGNHWVGQPKIFPLYSKRALDARLQGHENTLEVKGLMEFEDWARELIDGPKGKIIAYNARLKLVSESNVAAQSYYGDLIETTSRLLQKEENEYRQQVERARLEKQRRVRDAIQEVTLLSATLGTRQSLLKARIVDRVKTCMETDSNWKNTFQNTIQASIDEEIEAIRKAAKKAVGKTLSPAKFSPQIRINGVTVGDDSAGTIGAVAGVAAALLLASGPVGWVIGWVGGAYLGDKLFGGGAKTKFLNEVENLAGGLAGQITGAARNYHDGLLSSLDETRRVDETISQPASIEELRFRLKDYREALNWCRDLNRMIEEFRNKSIVAN